MSPPEAPYDWQRFWIHFVCGALLGAGLGFLFWLRTGESGVSLWLSTAGAAIVMAFLGGVFGDSFWERLVKLAGRWGWWV